MRKERAFWEDKYFDSIDAREGEIEHWKKVAEDFEQKYQDEKRRARKVN